MSTLISQIAPTINAAHHRTFTVKIPRTNKIRNGMPNQEALRDWDQTVRNWLTHRSHRRPQGR